MRLIFTVPTLCACLLAATTVVAADVAELMMTIQSNASSDVDRANAFEKVGDLAGEEAVEPLAAFLTDEKWSHYARFALQKMQCQGVTEALLQSLDVLEGDLRLGVIDTIGRRREAMVVPRLAKLLTHSDAAVAAATSVALGEIGTKDAAKALTETLDSEKDPGRRAALASSLLLVGQRLARTGNAEEAIGVFDHLRGAEVPRACQIGATQNAILVRGAQGVDLMVEQLKSQDRGFFQTGLAVARVLPGEQATKGLTDLLQAESSPNRQELLILALRDRGDRQALRSILEELKSDSTAVQLAAIDAVGMLGDDASVSVLLSAADDSNADAVLSSLVALRGDLVDAALIKAAEPPETSILAVKALGKRRAKDSASLMFQLSDGNSAISQEAIVALGTVVPQDQFLDLVTLLKNAKGGNRKQAIQKSIHAAVSRSTQPDACAEALGALIPTSSGADREFLFDEIRAAGGSKAVELMRQFATGTDETLQDAATKSLGRWLSADAAPVLLQVAQADGRFANRALGGYIRIVRQFELPETERVAMAAKALEVARRSNERNAAIDAMTRFPCVGTFDLALEQLDVPGSEPTAAKAVLTIGRIVLELDPEKGRAGLKKLIDKDVSKDTTESAKAMLQ